MKKEAGRMERRLGIAVLLLIGLWFGLAGAPRSEAADEAQWQDDAPVARMPLGELRRSAYLEETVAAVNRERAQAGLQPLRVHELLQKAAAARVREQPVLFSHIRPDGSAWSTVLDEAGIGYRFAAENIAAGQETPQEVVAAWMDSPGHRKNILTPEFSFVGTSILQAEDGTIYWEQLFMQEE